MSKLKGFSMSRFIILSVFLITSCALNHRGEEVKESSEDSSSLTSDGSLSLVLNNQNGFRTKLSFEDIEKLSKVTGIEYLEVSGLIKRELGGDYYYELRSSYFERKGTSSVIDEEFVEKARATYLDSDGNVAEVNLGLNVVVLFDPSFNPQTYTRVVNYNEKSLDLINNFQVCLSDPLIPSEFNTDDVSYTYGGAFSQKGIELVLDGGCGNKSYSLRRSTSGVTNTLLHDKDLLIEQTDLEIKIVDQKGDTHKIRFDFPYTIQGSEKLNDITTIEAVYLDKSISPYVVNYEHDDSSLEELANFSYTVESDLSAAYPATLTLSPNSVTIPGESLYDYCGPYPTNNNGQEEQAYLECEDEYEDLGIGASETVFKGFKVEIKVAEGDLDKFPNGIKIWKRYIVKVNANNKQYDLNVQIPVFAHNGKRIDYAKTATLKPLSSLYSLSPQNPFKMSEAGLDYVDYFLDDISCSVELWDNDGGLAGGDDPFPDFDGEASLEQNGEYILIQDLSSALKQKWSTTNGCGDINSCDWYINVDCSGSYYGTDDYLYEIRNLKFQILKKD